MSKPVDTGRSFSIEDVVKDVRERGDAALVEWSQLFDQTTADKPSGPWRMGTFPPRRCWQLRMRYAPGTRRNVPRT